MSSLDQSGQSMYVPPSGQEQPKKKTSPFVWLGFGCLGVILIFLLVCVGASKKAMNFAKAALVVSMKPEIIEAYRDPSQFEGDYDELIEISDQVADDLEKFKLLVEHKKITLLDIVEVNDKYDSAMHDSIMTRAEAEVIMEEINVLNDKYGID